MSALNAAFSADTETYSAVMDEWRIDDDNEIIVSLVKHKGRWRLDARVWFRDEEGILHPGKNGLALGVRHLERLFAAIEKTHRGAVARFIIAPSRPTESECTS